MSKYKAPKRPPPEIGLFMECEEDDLTPSQKMFYGKIKRDHQKFTKKMDEYIAKMKGELIVDEGDCFLFQIKHGLNVPAPAPAHTPIKPATEKQQAIKLPLSSAASNKGARYSTVPPAPAVKTPQTRGRRGRPPLSQPSPNAPVPARSKPSPSEQSSLGGLAIKSSSRIFTYASGDADSEEVTVAKLPGKNFPSLSVVVKPQMVVNTPLMHQASTERANLDVQVKGVLMYSAGKFTEWLIQLGLIRSEQSCAIHNAARKLGMFNDVSKFVYSGGYVWISDCCPNDFMSVYYGSILEGSCYVPIVILKLIYHWACHTNVANVVQWVKVPAIHVKEIYTLLRAACTLALHEKYGLLGGPGKKVQVAFYSFGSPLSSNKNPRIEVLGALDDSKRIRLIAVDTEKKRRTTASIVPLLASIIDPRSKILLDNSGCNITTFTNAGFTCLIQGDAKKIKDYMKTTLPRILLPCLHLLSKNIVQQFLDELVWRERWGPIAAHAFNNMTKHLADFTLHSKDERILYRLKNIAENPYRLYPTVAPPIAREEVVPKRGQKRAIENEALPPAKKPSTPVVHTPVLEPYWKVQPLDTGVTPEIAEFINSNSEVNLGSFFYGVLRGDDNKIIDRKPADQVVLKCSVCLRPFFDNLMLLKHMLLHYQEKPVSPGPLRSTQQCQKCFIAFPSLQGLRNHQSEVHSPSPDMVDRMCFICEKLFVDKVQLVYHMHRTHVPQELPYACHVCGYRTSWHTALIEHFAQTHQGGRHLLCPYCLLTVGLTRNDEAVSSNVAFFASHVQRHQREADAHCHRCRLSFLSAHFLERHIEQDHCSMRLNENVTPFNAGCTTMMPAPGALIKAALLPSFKERIRKPGQYSVREFPTPICPLVPASARCAECEDSMAKPGHYSGVLKCSKCKYQSCCEVAASEHFNFYHEKNDPMVFSSGQASLTMYCVCSFFSSSPNTLAKHLVRCGKTVAYPSERAAQEALRRDTHEEDTEHTVLNVLGLMRNPSEPVVPKLLEPEKREALSEPDIPISQPKVVLSKLELTDVFESTSTMDEDLEATVTAPSSQEENVSAGACGVEQTASPNQTSPEDEGDVNETIQESSVERSSPKEGESTDVQTSQPATTVKKYVDMNTTECGKDMPEEPMEIVNETSNSDLQDNAQADEKAEEAQVPTGDTEGNNVPGNVEPDEKAEEAHVPTSEPEAGLAGESVAVTEQDEKAEETHVPATEPEAGLAGESAVVTEQDEKAEETQVPATEPEAGLAGESAVVTEQDEKAEETQVPATEPEAGLTGESVAVVTEEQREAAPAPASVAAPSVEETSDKVVGDKVTVPEEAKTEESGRWIEELENMMDTDDITPSVVIEAPDFVTDFMNSDSA